MDKISKMKILPAYTATKMLWMKNNEPENYEKLASCLLPHDYINHWLTGIKAMERGDASGVGLMDMETKEWDQNLVMRYDFAKFLPKRFQDPDHFIGPLKPQVARELGLPEEGIFVSPGSGDNMMAALGAGSVEDGKFVASLGTSGTIFCSHSKLIVDDLVSSFCDSLGGYLPLVCTQNCAQVPEEVRKCFGLDWEEITSLAEAENTGCGGLVVVPYLTGERTPNEPKSNGVIYGLRPEMHKRPGLLYRAALEGATFSIFEGYLRMAKKGLEATDLKLVGGGAKNRLWRRIFADLFNAHVSTLSESESAALGAAFQAAAIGEGQSVRDYIRENPPKTREGESVYPNPAGTEAIRKAYMRWKSVRDTMQWDNLANQAESISRMGVQEGDEEKDPDWPSYDDRLLNLQKFIEELENQSSQTSQSPLPVLPETLG
ncbi:hypothetical protein AAMO2058_001317300 [Amorphochlora amoebiformis]